MLLLLRLFLYTKDFLMNKNNIEHDDYINSIDDAYIDTFQDSNGIPWSSYEDYQVEEYEDYQVEN